MLPCLHCRHPCFNHQYVMSLSYHAKSFQTCPPRSAQLSTGQMQATCRNPSIHDCNVPPAPLDAQYLLILYTSWFMHQQLRCHTQAPRHDAPCIGLYIKGKQSQPTLTHLHHPKSKQPPFILPILVAASSSLYFLTYIAASFVPKHYYSSPAKGN